METEQKQKKAIREFQIIVTVCAIFLYIFFLITKLCTRPESVTILQAVLQATGAYLVIAFVVLILAIACGYSARGGF